MCDGEILKAFPLIMGKSKDTYSHYFCSPRYSVLEILVRTIRQEKEKGYYSCKGGKKHLFADIIVYT